ncbi:MAG: energy transducer TonB [Proteobacteria bacterium]|nr:energy transducer TonB [Pseudomonadota bacterium]
MKRFFFLSIFFHGALLLILFFWETPLANKFSPRGIIAVSLIEKIEEKKPQKTLPQNRQEREKGQKKEKKEALPPREHKKIIKVEKTEEKAKEKKVEKAVEKEVEKTVEKTEEKKEEKEEEKKEPALAVLQEEKIKETEELPPENKFLRTSVEQPLPIQANVMPLTRGSGNAEVLKGSTAGERNIMAQGASGETSRSTFLMFNASGLEKGGTGGEGTKGTGFGKMGEGSHLTVSKMHSSLIEIDQILKQIIRKIEAAKRYPRVARKMGIEGKAVVRFKLKAQGQVETVEIVESSGSEILDRASLQTVRDAAPLPYKEGWLKVGIVFKIL